MTNEPQAQTFESAELLAASFHAPATTFFPVELRARADGWTPHRQRVFVEALADTGLIVEALGRVGMSEQSFAELRRRPGSGSFVAACEAAITIAMRRIRSIAFERAINGTTKQHFYHGELKGEERVFDTRLLILLLQKSGLLTDPLGRGAKLEATWSRTVAALDDGAAERSGEDDDEDEVWREGRRPWTSFPPPPDFCGTERGKRGTKNYRRTLTAAETAVIEAREAHLDESAKGDAEDRRDAYFGFSADPACG